MVGNFQVSNVATFSCFVIFTKMKVKSSILKVHCIKHSGKIESHWQNLVYEAQCWPIGIPSDFMDFYVLPF
jgi:hypothetical protein